VQDIETYVDAVFSCLRSEFLVLPKGDGFIDYPTFEDAYEHLKKVTKSFQAVLPNIVEQAVYDKPLSLLVIRTILGFTPPEWAYLATEQSGIEITQGWVRSLDRRLRMDLGASLSSTPLQKSRIRALVATACVLLVNGAPNVEPDRLHRLDKADTRNGLDSLRSLSTMGAPYAMLLYERFLGRPYAAHRDSVSEIVGDELENALETHLDRAGISFRKTKRAEKIPGFDQAPDFIVPSEFNPQVVIECKITEDDGMARDKVTRIQHLAELSGSKSLPHFETVACIGGRGFGVRRQDMRKLLYATNGKVFTRNTLDRIVTHTRVSEFKSK